MSAPPCLVRALGLPALAVLAVLLVLSAVAPVRAGHEEIPRITVQELHALLAAGDGSVLVLDTQVREVYDEGHIKGAASFPWAEEIDPGAAAGLPRDRLVVTYCGCGPGESDSADVAAQLLRMGFPRVKVLADPSSLGWMQAGYPMER
jgi:rhodanese-related sulfurtransferase